MLTNGIVTVNYATGVFLKKRIIKISPIDLVIDTPTQGHGDKTRDGFLIRRNSIETGVNCITAIDTAVALATSLESATTEYTLVDVATI